MAHTITATQIDASPLDFFQIDVVLDTPATITGWTVTRLAAPHPQVTIKISTSEFPESFEDHEAPLGVPIAYRLEVRRESGTTETAVSNLVEISSTTGCFLSDPYSAQVMPIEVQAWPERRYAARASILEVIARPDPIGLSDVHTWADGTWTLITRTDALTAQMLAILQSSGVVQLRTQPGTSIRSGYALVGDISETRYTGAGTDQRRLTDVDIQEIAPVPASARNLDASLEGLHSLAETLLELSQVRPTLLQLSQLRVG